MFGQLTEQSVGGQGLVPALANVDQLCPDRERQRQPLRAQQLNRQADLHPFEVRGPRES